MQSKVTVIEMIDFTINCLWWWFLPAYKLPFLRTLIFAPEAAALKFVSARFRLRINEWKWNIMFSELVEYCAPTSLSVLTTKSRKFSSTLQLQWVIIQVCRNPTLTVTSSRIIELNEQLPMTRFLPVHGHNVKSYLQGLKIPYLFTVVNAFFFCFMDLFINPTFQILSGFFQCRLNTPYTSCDVPCSSAIHGLVSLWTMSTVSEALRYRLEYLWLLLFCMWRHFP